jgi:hypothetical protein
MDIFRIQTAKATFRACILSATVPFVGFVALFGNGAHHWMRSNKLLVGASVVGTFFVSRESLRRYYGFNSHNWTRHNYARMTILLRNAHVKH